MPVLRTSAFAVALAVSATEARRAKTAFVQVNLKHRLSDEEIETDFVARTSPKGAKFREWLKPSELHTVYGAPEAAVAATEAYAKSLAGASKVTTFVTKHALAMQVEEGSAAAAAFGLAAPVHFAEDLKDYKDVTPVTPTAIAAYTRNVLVAGGFETEKPRRAVRARAGRMSGTTTTPQVISKAYDVPLTAAVVPKHYSQGVTEWGGSWTKADIKKFFTHFNVPAPNVTEAFGPNSGPKGESELDVQQIGVAGTAIPVQFMSSNLSHGAPGPGMSTSWMCNNILALPHPPSVVSQSYGAVVSDWHSAWIAGDDTMLKAVGTAGITFLNAAGDDGPGDRNSNACSSFKVSWPSASAYLTSVGGTMLGVDGAGVESAWNAGGGGGGCGFSSVSPVQSWQKDAVAKYLARSTQTGGSMPPASLYNKSGRAYPDITAFAWNVPEVNGGWLYNCGGTSAASPMAAGIISRINTERIAAGKKTLGFVNPALYALGTAGKDITKGKIIDYCQGGPAAGHGFPAGEGWDSATGLGSLSFSYLKKKLV